MKVERWEEETDEEWAERLTEEIAIANNTDISEYFVERDSYAEDAVIINYIGEDAWTWKEHPEGPFKADQIITWKNKAMNKFDFKQCLEEYPISKETNNKKIIHELNTNPVFEDIIMRTQAWYYKWFSQFLPHICNECGYLEEDTCLVGERDGPLMGFTQTVHHITKHVVGCSYFQSSSGSAKE